MDGIHDMGGMAGFGPVVPDEAVFHEPWERRLFALTRVCRAAGITAGHFREAIESMPPDEYLDATYYERWMYGLERRLERAGSLAPGDMDEALARVQGGPLPERSDPELTERVLVIQRSGNPLPPAAAPHYAPGDSVRVRRMRPAGHSRCPRYVRGATGVVERVHGDDLLADAAARGRDEPVEAVYAVSFRSQDLFGSGEEPSFHVLVDLSESYLEEPG